MRIRPIPENAVEPIGIMIYVQGALTNADSNPTLVVNNTSNGVVLVSGSSTQESTGKYQYMLQSTQTAVQGSYDVNWTYTISGSPRLYTDSFVITDQMPYWQNLTYDERQLVTGIVHRLDKSFDSTAGGPYLQELRQSGFNIY